MASRFCATPRSRAKSNRPCVPHYQCWFLNNQTTCDQSCGKFPCAIWIIKQAKDRTIRNLNKGILVHQTCINLWLGAQWTVAPIMTARMGASKSIRNFSAFNAVRFSSPKIRMCLLIAPSNTCAGKVTGVRAHQVHALEPDLGIGCKGKV